MPFGPVARSAYAACRCGQVISNVRPQVTQPMHSRSLRPHCHLARSVQRCQIASLHARSDGHDERLGSSKESALRSAPPGAASSNTSEHEQDENRVWFAGRRSVGHAMPYECKVPAEVDSVLVKLRRSAKQKCSFALVPSSAQSGQHLGQSSVPQLQIMATPRLRPNTPINLTRNGMRPLSGGVRFAHSTPPASGRMPLRAGYRQR
jgi:hypothetical protein